jgi:MFS family permease
MNFGVLALSFCKALLSTGNVLLVAVTALIGQTLSPDPIWATLPVAFQFIGLMCATIPASLVMDKIGRKNGFYLGNALGIAGALLCIQALYSASFNLFCVGTFFLGIGIGFGTLYRFAAVEMCEKPYRAKAISIIMAGGVLAAIAGPNLAIFSQDLVQDTPYVGAFWGLLMLYIAAMLVLAIVKFPPQVVHAPGVTTRPVIEIILQPIFLVSVIAGMMSYVVMNLLMTATPLAMHHHGFQFEHSAFVIQLHALGMFLPGFFTGDLIKRFGTIRILLIGAMIMLACIGINLNGESELHFSVSLFMLGLGWNFMFVSATHLVTDAYSEAEKPKAQAANEFLIFSMVTVSALASGWLEATLGWHVMNLICIPIVLFAILVVLYFHRKMTLNLAHLN